MFRSRRLQAHPGSIELEPRAILLDIEGTVTPVSFVFDVLFPFAREFGPAFLKEHWTEDRLNESKRQLAEQNALDLQSGAPAMVKSTAEIECASAVAYFLWLMDQDSKATPLKYLQGLVWKQGFESGELRSEIFPDVLPALTRWSEQGRTAAIYSSGSVEAQQQLFRHTKTGDLTPLLKRYFDTSVGAKREASSYARIVRELSAQAEHTLFISDVLQELDAARSAGLQTALCVRPGNAPIKTLHNHSVIQTFDELF
jgi:enolase-phosphatase E1